MTFQILLVDDEPHVVDAIRSILEQNAEVELEIRSAYRGQQALKLCEQFPINLLITDIRMPDMSGLELARKAKQINPDCEVILLTAHSDFDYAYEGLRLHAADYILKTEESCTIAQRILKVMDTMEKNLNHQSWLGEKERDDPLKAQLLERLLVPDRASRQEEAFSLLGFADSGIPLLLVVCQSMPEVPFRSALVEKAIKCCLAWRMEKIVSSPMRNGCCVFIIQLASGADSLSSKWLIASMERVQSVYNATCGEECAIYVSSVVNGIGRLPQLYKDISESLQEDGFVPCVRLIADNRDVSTHVTVRFIKNYVKTNIGNDLSLSQISEVTGYNPAYLSRLFKEQTGETMNQYITRKRMDHISQLLQKPELSIQQVMELSGFTTRAYFSQFIKRETGMTPRNYRNHLGIKVNQKH